MHDQDVDSRVRWQTAVSELAETLRPEIADMAADLAKTILNELPVYGEGTVTAEELERSCTANLLIHIDALTRAADLDVASLGESSFNPAARSTGARRACEGFPLDAVLHAYRIGGRIVWHRLLAHAQQRGDIAPAVLVDAASFIWEVNEANAAAATEAYRRARGDRSDQQERQERQAFDAVLDGAIGQQVTAADAALLLGLTPGGPFVVVVAELGDTDPVLGVGAHSVRSSSSGHPLQGEPAPAATLLTAGMPSAWRLRAGRQVGLVCGADTPRGTLRDLLAGCFPGRVGISPPFSDLTCGQRGLAHAETALRTLAPGSRDVACLDDSLPAALVVEAPDIAMRLRDGLLDPLDVVEPAERAVLLETLDMFLVCGSSASRAADLLFCHRNTVLNRLRRIEALTGRQLSDSRTVLEFGLALEAERIAPR